MQEYIHTLKNGLTVILIDTKAFPSLTTLLLVGAGSRYENEKNNGIAHFFEHMAFKGSKKFPNSFTISSTIEGIGGVFNAFTGKDHTGYWIKSTVEHFTTVIDVLSDMVLNPLLAPEEIEREKGVISEEINMYEDTPQRKVGELFEGLLYQGNPLGFDIAGEKPMVKTFTRGVFKKYIDRLYHPKNAVLVVAGGLNKIKNQKSKVENYLDLIEEKYHQWENGARSKFEPMREKQRKPQLLVKCKKTEQAHFCLGFRAFSFFDERKYSLMVLSALLGGGMSSRLFIEVRERRGLCYYISTGRELYHDVGNMVTQAGVSTDLQKVREAIAIILKEHVKIAQGDFKKDEVRRAKELVKGRFALSLEDSFNIASLYGTRMLFEHEIKNPDAILHAIEKVTTEDIVKTASDIIKNEGLNMALIGPFEKKSLFEEVLHIEA